MEKRPISSGKFNLKSDFLQYIDRKTGQLCVEKVHGGGLVKLLYMETVFSRFFLFLIAKFSTSSRFYGWLMKRSWTRALVGPFIHTYGIDTTEFEKNKFESFNDFFTRRLRKEARPMADGLVMPADGRYLVYPQIENVYAKGQRFSVEELLGDQKLAKRYDGGSMVIVRLCPVDYHRYHFPCDGVPGPARLINGPLFSVNPLALRKRLSILWENKRMVTEFDTVQFGKIAYVEIGATNVGSIRQTYAPGKPVQKGDEKGYFEFGGSCLVLLFEPGKVVFASDLIENSQNRLETLCRLGESLSK